MLITVLFTVAKRWKQPKYSSANAWIDKMRHILIHQCNAAAAKSLQSCPTLCDPIDDSPPGSPVHEIFQARTLEWVAIAFSSIERYSALKTNEFGCMCEWPWKHVRHKKINAVWFTIYVIYNSKIHRNRKKNDSSGWWKEAKWNYYLMDTEFQFRMIRNKLWIWNSDLGCTIVWMYLMSVNCALKDG